MKVERPVLRYHGGKFRLAPWIISNFPEHRIYVEPFGGGASVLMRKPRAYAEVYNDLDGEVVNVFRVLQDPVAAVELERILWLTPYSRDEFEMAYTLSDDPIEQARRTIIKSFMGFGSDSIHRGRAASIGMRTVASTSLPGTGFRCDSNRSHTTPAHDWANYPDAMASFVKRLRGVVIENRPAVDVIRLHDRVDTLHYIDPPYLMDTRGDKSHGYRHEMTDSDHIDLAKVLCTLRGMVVVSGYPSDLYNDLYRGWMRIEHDARAHCNLERTEVLWISPNVPVKQHELFTEAGKCTES